MKKVDYFLLFDCSEKVKENNEEFSFLFGFERKIKRIGKLAFLVF